MEFDPFTVHLDPPLSTARGTLDVREGFLVTVEDSDETGIGEATPLLGWTESLAECRDSLERARAIAGELDWGIALAKTDAPAARHGLSLAFADARARSAGDPLYRWLGDGRPVETVPVNGTIGADGTPAETARRAQRAVEDGFDCLKIKVGTNGLEEDVERVRAVREAVGDEIALRVDANGALTPEEADRAVEAFAALAVSYLEQPLPAGDLDGLANLRGRGVDVALDESLTVHDAETLLDAGAADVLVCKPMVLGGPDPAVEVARTARRAGVEPVVSTTVDAVVARTAAVHVAATIPDVAPCGLATAGRLVTDLAPDPAPVADGQIPVPQGKGLGLSTRPTN